MLKGTYHNPIRKKEIEIVVKDSYRLVPMALREFGGCFKLDCHKEVMPYEIYTYENVSMGACRIQDAINVLKTGDDKQQLLDNIETWECVIGKGMNNQMCDLLKECSSIYCKMDCKVLMDGYEVFRSCMIEHTGLDVDIVITVQSMASTFMLKLVVIKRYIKSVVYYNNLLLNVWLGVGLLQQAINNIMLKRK